MPALSADPIPGNTVKLPAKIDLGTARLSPKVVFEYLLVEGRNSPVYKSVPQEVVAHLMSSCRTSPKDAGELPLADVAQYAETQFHAPRGPTQVLAVRRVVTFEGIDSSDGVTVVKGPDPALSLQAWIGREPRRFFTPAEASAYQYAGRTALAWASVNGVTPSRVVQAQNGFFYPCSLSDVGLQVR